MFRECRHMMPTGVHCQSPAMGNSAYCYHHDRLHRHFGTTHQRRKSVQLSKLDNRQAIVAGLTDVMNAILAGKVDLRQAGRLMFGMQIAESSLRKASNLENTVSANDKIRLRPATQDLP